MGVPSPVVPVNCLAGEPVKARRILFGVLFGPLGFNILKKHQFSQALPLGVVVVHGPGDRAMELRSSWSVFLTLSDVRSS